MLIQYDKLSIYQEAINALGVGANMVKSMRYWLDLCGLIEKGGAHRHLYGVKSEGYIEPFFYCAPENPMKLQEYIQNALGYPIAYQNTYEEKRLQVLALSYLIDQCRWEEGVSSFLKSDVSAQSAIYDYCFRKLAHAGRVNDAREISVNLLDKIRLGAKTPEYEGEAELIRFYLEQLG